MIGDVNNIILQLHVHAQKSYTTIQNWSHAEGADTTLLLSSVHRLSFLRGYIHAYGNMRL